MSYSKIGFSDLRGSINSQIKEKAACCFLNPKWGPFRVSWGSIWQRNLARWEKSQAPLLAFNGRSVLCNWFRWTEMVIWSPVQRAKETAVLDIKGENRTPFTHLIWSQPGRCTFHFLVDVDLCISNTQQKNLELSVYFLQNYKSKKKNAIMFLMPASSMRLEVIPVL